MAVCVERCMPLSVKEVFKIVRENLDKAVTRLQSPSGGDVFVYRYENYANGGKGNCVH